MGPRSLLLVLWVRMLAWAREQLATVKAGAEQAVVRGKGLGARSQRRDSVWTPGAVTLVTGSWEALEALASSCLSFFRAAEVSVAKLLVIPFFN